MDPTDVLPEAVKAVFRVRDAVLRERERRAAEEATWMDMKSSHSQRRSANYQLLERYKELLEGGGRYSPQNQNNCSSRIEELRRMVVLDGIPTTNCGIETSKRDADHPDVNQHYSLRALIWKILLGVMHIDAGAYIKLVEQGASCKDSVIKLDTCRTFKGDEEFKRRVSEEKLSRINNAFVRLTLTEQDQISAELRNEMQRWNEDRGNDEAEINGGEGGKGTYVQGMTILSGALLFEMPEVDAFYSFYTLMTHHMPRYIARNLDGVHAGCALVDRILSLVDPPLAAHFHEHTLTANIYAFPFVLSLHACIPPFVEVLKVWDALFAYGVHLECILLRGTLLPDSKPYRHLIPRHIRPLDAEVLVSSAFSLLEYVPQEVLDEVVRHPLISEQEAKHLSGANVAVMGGRT